jgi:hypothetical protein
VDAAYNLLKSVLILLNENDFTHNLCTEKKTMSRAHVQIDINKLFEWLSATDRVLGLGFDFIQFVFRIRYTGTLYRTEYRTLNTQKTRRKYEEGKPFKVTQI